MGTEAAFEIATILADESRLAVGMCLSDHEVERLLLLDQPYRARARSLSLLAVKDRAGSEIHSRLAQSDFDEEVIAATIEWLRERGYVDDSRFIQSYAA
jgi:SOS response regulatory protein OraA/RecX